jgi:gliding motility-associated-like protein
MKKQLLFIATFFVSLFISQNVYSTQWVVNTAGNTFGANTNLSINIGDTVIWNNTGGFHNVNATLATYPGNPEGFGNAVAGAGWSFQWIFTIAGTYDYQCDPHLALGMVGEITVIAPNTPLISSITHNNPLCFGDFDGNADSVSINQTSPATDVTVKLYWLNPISGFWINLGTASGLNNNFSFPNLGSGNYRIDLINTASGVLIDDEFFTLVDPPAIIVTSLISNSISCYGLSDGSIDISVSGGTPIPGIPATYNYLWSDGQTTEIATNLAAGIYNVIITDANGCTAQAQITINQPDFLQASGFVSQNIIGFGNSNGEITAQVSGGTPPYNYSINNGSFTSNNLFQNLSASTYLLEYEDSNSCVISQNITLNNPVQLSGYVAILSPVTCNDSCDGSITFVNNNSGNPPYTYSLNGGLPQSSNIFNNLCGDSMYSISMMDSQNSLLIDSIYLTQPTSLIFSVSTTNFNGWSVACNGGVGGITLSNPSGGNGAPISYSFDGGITFIQSWIQSALQAGTYYLAIQDAFGCKTYDTTVLTEPSQIQNDFTINDVLCFGENNGIITPITTGGTPTGGNPSYIYDWGGINPASAQAGTYTVDITDANGCSITDTAIVEEPNPLLLSLNSVNNYGVDATGVPYFISCNGANDGAVLATPSGGSLPYQPYLWSDGQSSNPAISLVEGFINCTLTDGNNCTVIESVLLTEPSIIIDNETLSTNSYGYEVSCFGASDGWISLNPTGGVPQSNGSYSYNWSNSASVDSVANGLSASPPNYSVDVIDANGCSYSFNYFLNEPSEAFNASVSTLNYAGPSHPPVNVIFSDATIDSFGNPISVNHTWYWSNDGAAEPFPNDITTFEHVFTEVGSNDVYVLVQNANSGCIDTVNFIIDVQGIDYITNVFSPNGDGINDEFVFDEFGIKIISVEIYNRWGSLVMNWTDLDKGWNGRGSDGQDLPDGVYFYSLTAEGEDGHYYENKGSITLLR